MTYIQISSKIIISFFIFFCFFVLSFGTLANEQEILKKISSKLRCMTCQNQTIYDSDSDFSKDLKLIILKKIKQNQSEKEIINFLIKRYGEYIVFEPQMNKRNLFLWYFPFIILTISLIFLIFRIKKN